MNSEYRYGKTVKNIAKTIQAKLDDWAESVVDLNVRKTILNSSIVTGGCIASMLLGEKVNDFDVYFKDFASAKTVADYYVKQWNFAKGDDVELRCDDGKSIKIFIKSAGVAGNASDHEQEDPVEDEETGCDLIEEPAEATAYSPVFLSANAITLSNKVQIIIRFFGDVSEIHKNFDFVHATSYYSNRALVLPGPALESILARTLVYSGSLYPIASIFRLKKFLNRGWKVNAGTMLKIMWQISELNMRDKKVMAEQLTGVDQTYLMHLVEALRDVDPEMVNSTYVAEIIDRIFGL